MRAYEDEFPGLTLLSDDNDESDSEQDNRSDNDLVEVSVTESDETSSDEDSVSPDEPDSDNDGDNGGEQQELTHYPAKPSSFGESDSEEGDGESSSDYESADDEAAAEETGGEAETRQSNRPGLRPVKPVKYTHKAMPVGVTTSDEPKLNVALKSPERSSWLKAIEEEFETLRSAETWEEDCIPPPHAKILPSHIILKLKRDENGRPKRFKARLVAGGNHQKLVLYIELYAPVACIDAVRILLAVAVSKGWVTLHLDIKGAFLYARLKDEEEIWVRLPAIPGSSDRSSKVVKLRKSLYGLRQSPKLWYGHLAATLRQLGFTRSKANDCLFSRVTKTDAVHLLVYVDDLLIVGTADAVAQVKEELARKYTTSDLGECTQFLGIKVERRPDGLFLSQKAYAERIVEKAGMEDAKPASTPLPMAHPLYEPRTETTEADRKFMERAPYRELLGSLLFLATRTRPDLMAAVSMLAKFQADPGIKHWKSLKSVIRYLKATSPYGILLPSGGAGVQLTAYSDADWARDQERRRSRTGYLLTVNGGPVVWCSKLQPATTMSTTEAEFYALSTCIRDVVWVRALLADLQSRQQSETVIYQDNLGTIRWTDDVQGLRKVKHIGIRYNYVRDAVDGHHIALEYVPTDKNRADSLTKILLAASFEMHRTWLGCHRDGQHAHHRGGVSEQ